MAASDYINQVQSMYISYYGRFADQAGLNYWTYMLDANGGNLDGIIQAFGTSAEATALYPATLSTAQKVTNLYNSLFGRDPDAAGLTFYTNLIGSGQATLVDIAKRVFDGATAEDANRLANKVNASNTLTQSVGATANYSGDAAAATARALMNNITNDPASITPVQNVMGAAVTSAKTTGTAITTMAAANAAATASSLPITSGTATTLDSIVDFGTQNLTITDVAGTNIAASVLSSIGGKTTGTVTVQNAINITGTVAQATAALVTPATLVTAATANVTFTSTATTTAADLKAIDAATTGAIDASNVDAITALAAADFAIVGGTGAAGTGGVIRTKDAVAVTVADAISATNLNTLAGLTTGVVTATIATGAVTATLGAIGNVLTTDTITFTTNDTTVDASDFNALAAKVDNFTHTSVTGAVTEDATTVAGDDAVGVAAALTTLGSDNAATISGTISAANANIIANVTSGVVTAMVTAGTASALNTALTEVNNSNLLTVTVNDSTAAATDLTGLDSKTGVAVVATSVTEVTGTAAQIAAYATAETAGTITAATNYAAAASDATVTATVLNTIDAANGNGTITTTNAGGWTITGLNSLAVVGTGSVDTFVFGAADTGVAITGFKATGADKLNVDALTTSAGFDASHTAAANSATAVTIGAGKIYLVTGGSAGDADGAAAAAAEITSAGAWTNATNGDVAYFVVVDDNSTGIFKYVEAGTAEVDTAELTLIGTINGVNAAADFVFA